MKKKLNEPSRKLGAKYLDDIQLEGCFPDWKALLTRIEEQRQIAELTGNDCYQAEDGHFPQTYDNLFAVLGGRGSGKSSVILTLREKMKYPENQDILLPIITPEIISGKECSILGWIMSAADSVVSDLEKRINKLHQKMSNCTTVWDQELNDFFKDCRFRKDNSLRRQYEELFEKTIASSGRIDLSLYSVEDAADYRTAQSRKQYKLIQDLNSFWNHLSEVWHKTYLQEVLLNHGNIDEKEINKRPLIILIFDDIDLVPERSMELLNTTFQYFTNPNIVIILTAAEKVLKEVIHLKMFERMVGSEAKSLLMGAVPWTYKGIEAKNQGLNSFELNPIDKMAREFYDKVIPPSSRYHLRRYESINEKEAYAYSSSGQSFEVTQAGKRVSIPIDKFLINQVDRLILAYSRSKNVKYNFLLGGKEQQIFQKAYLLIFGEKNRNIANGCLEIINTFDRLERCKQYKSGKHEETLLTLRHLAKALLLANPVLEEYADKVNSFLYSAPDRIGTYVDYNFALQCFENAKQEIRGWIESEQQRDDSISEERLFQKELSYLRKAKDKIAALMMLLFFIEGILVTIDSRRHHIHGYRQLSYLLNTDIIDMHARKSGKKNLVLFPEHQEASDFLHNYPLVLEHSGRYLGTNQYDIQYARNYLEDIFHVRIIHEKENPVDIIQAAIDKNRDWVTTVLTMLLIRFSGITLVDAGCIKLPAEIQRRLDLFSFTIQFISQRRKAIKEFLAQDNLLEAYQNTMTGFQQLIQKEYDWNSIAEGQEIFLMNIEGRSLQLCNDQYDAFVAKDTDYIKAYFVQRWKEYFGQSSGTKDSLTNLCYRLLRFAEDSLKSCVSLLCSHATMLLYESDIAAIREQLHNIHAYNANTFTKKEECITELTKASLSINENAHEVEGGNNQTNKLVTISATPFIDFLVTYKKEIDRVDQDLSTYAYYEIHESRTYFKLLSKLVISLDNEMDIGGVVMPGSSMVISELKMLEFLFPYEIAAHIGIAEDSRYPSELPTRECEPTGNIVDKQLMESYQSLIKLERTEHLGKLMDEARTKLAEDYYNYLENGDE